MIIMCIWRNEVSKIILKNIKLINKNIFICYTFKRDWYSFSVSPILLFFYALDTLLKGVFLLIIDNDKKNSEGLAKNQTIC